MLSGQPSRRWQEQPELSAHATIPDESAVSLRHTARIKNGQCSSDIDKKIRRVYNFAFLHYIRYTPAPDNATQLLQLPRTLSISYTRYATTGYIFVSFITEHHLT